MSPRSSFGSSSSSEHLRNLLDLTYNQGMTNDTTSTPAYRIISKSRGMLHVDGLDAVTTGGGVDKGDYITAWTFSPCAGLTRIRFFHYVNFASDSLAEIERKLAVLDGYAGSRCKNCDKALAAAIEKEVQA